MCIRDSQGTRHRIGDQGRRNAFVDELPRGEASALHDRTGLCLLYTSDAADERSSVDLGGRRIIKKKKHPETEGMRA